MSGSSTRLAEVKHLSMHSAVTRLVKLVAWAPSGDNTQPWQFVYRQRDGSLALVLEDARIDEPAVLWRFVAHMSCGAAVENLGRAAPALGLHAVPEAPQPGELARFRLCLSGEKGLGSNGLEVIRRRATNRRVYDGEPVADEVVGRLRRATPAGEGIETIWITETERIRQLASVLYHIDATMYGLREMWKPIEERIRFDRPGREPAKEGLAVGSLELPRWKTALMGGLRKLPHAILRRFGVVRAFSRRTRKLILSSSGLCLVIGDTEGRDVEMGAGRALQRAWLALTSEGLVAHPMNAIALMEHMGKYADGNLGRCVRETRIGKYAAQFDALVPEAAGRRKMFLMRFGNAPDPTVRNGRLPISDILRTDRSSVDAERG